MTEKEGHLAHHDETHGKEETHDGHEATQTSDEFLDKEKHGFLRTLSHTIWTAGGEFFTWFGGKLAPAGAVVAASLYANELQGVSVIGDLMKGKIGDSIIESSKNVIGILWDRSINITKEVAIGSSVIGLAADTIGTWMGWQGAKHGGRDTRRLFWAGKAAELGAAAATILNPGTAWLYPIAKAFSIGATFWGHTKSP
jgi:hypothetical protein